MSEYYFILVLDCLLIPIRPLDNTLSTDFHFGELLINVLFMRVKSCVATLLSIYIYNTYKS